MPNKELLKGKLYQLSKNNRFIWYYDSIAKMQRINYTPKRADLLGAKNILTILLFLDSTNEGMWIKHRFLYESNVLWFAKIVKEHDEYFLNDWTLVQ